MADPSSISGLTARWRADSITGVASGSAVASWPDLGPNGYTATQVSPYQPTFQVGGLSGRPTVRFAAASSQNMNTSQPIDLSAQTVIVVLALSGSGTRTWRGGLQKAGALQVRALSSGAPDLVSQGVAAIGTATATIANGTPSVVVATFNYSTGAYSFRINGTAAGAGTKTGLSNVSDVASIGSNRSSEFFSGDIAELLAWNRVLTAAEQASVDSYVQDRYGITVADYVPNPGVLAGSGTLSATSTPAVQQPGALSGSGSLSGTGQPAVVAPGPLTGSGQLSGTGSPTYSTAPGLSGSGLLTGTTRPDVTSPGSLTGSGTVTAAAAPSFTQPGALTGSGTLTSVAAPGGLAQGALTGSGQIDVVGFPIVTSAPTLTGLGVLSGTGVAVVGSRIYMGGRRGLLAYLGSTAVHRIYRGAHRLFP